MPRGDFCPLGQVVWGLVGAKVRLPRPTNCANAPRWFSSLFLLCEEEFFDHGLDVVEAEGSLPNLAGGWGLLGRKYAYLVLPTVLMPRLRHMDAWTVYHQIKLFSSPVCGKSPQE